MASQRSIVYVISDAGLEKARRPARGFFEENVDPRGRSAEFLFA